MLYSLENVTDEDDTERQGDVVHNMRYLASVVTQCFSAFGEILGLSKRVAELSGGVGRVSELIEVLKEAQDREKKAAAARIAAAAAEGSAGAAAAAAGAEGGDTDKAAHIAFEGADIITPQGKMLARQLSVGVTPGTNLLVTGPNGSGKSSLFRVLRGLWPLISGRLHKTGSVFYVPQKPYTTVGTFREQLVYPLTVEEAAAREEGATEAERKAALDRRLSGILDAVRLSYLLAERYQWTSEIEWSETLSLGEQQRLGMARLFYHRPRFAVLDECTNATSVDVEEHLYRCVSELYPLFQYSRTLPKASRACILSSRTYVTAEPLYSVCKTTDSPPSLSVH
jgi:ABC-type uncharacterized transport system fused permease/ATPase subunit